MALRIAAVITTILLTAAGCSCHAAGDDAVGGQASPTLDTSPSLDTLPSQNPPPSLDAAAPVAFRFSGFHGELCGVPFTVCDDPFVESVTEKEHRAGLTTAVGMLLRSQRNHLPNPDDYQRKQQQTEQEIVRFQTEQMQLEDERGGSGDIQTQVDSECTAR